MSTPRLRVPVAHERKLDPGGRGRHRAGRRTRRRGEQRYGTLVHWGYGTAWGAVRRLVAATGLCGPAAATAHFALVWGGEQVVLPATGAGFPTPRYGAVAPATDALHHVVCAVATSAAYEWLDPQAHALSDRSSDADPDERRPRAPAGVERQA
ncbi:hypothetical protein [Pseudonocardia endophytica]|uniref:hypothetical protein n=1 Tax=Pseudonocardia endophytica TaxID=401976 RepID=UPI00104A6C27|nr:hypothetical protein [Pseudonocardia endophytica]